MRIALVILLTLGVIFAAGQIWSSASKKGIEMHKYKVLKSFDDFEIREYEQANFAYVTMSPQTYDQSSGTGFRMLAGYIFGGNDESQQIAMTSPVSMTMTDSVTMQFMVPSSYEIKDLPTPDDTRVKFKTEPGKIMAAIQFGGWANDKKIKKHTQDLKKHLDESGVEHLNNFSYLGYNPPYEVVNRRNEVVVEVEWK